MFNDVFLKNLAIYEIMWKNFVQPGKPQMTIWCMHIACWIRTATNTHSEYVLLMAFSLQQWLHAHISLLRYMHIAWLVVILLRQYCDIYKRKYSRPLSFLGLCIIITCILRRITGNLHSSQCMLLTHTRLCLHRHGLMHKRLHMYACLTWYLPYGLHFCTFYNF